MCAVESVHVYIYFCKQRTLDRISPLILLCLAANYYIRCNYLYIPSFPHKRHLTRPYLGKRSFESLSSCFYSWREIAAPFCNRKCWPPVRTLSFQLWKLVLLLIYRGTNDNFHKIISHAGHDMVDAFCWLKPVWYIYAHEGIYGPMTQSMLMSIDWVLGKDHWMILLSERTRNEVHFCGCPSSFFSTLALVFSMPSQTCCKGGIHKLGEEWRWCDFCFLAMIVNKRLDGIKWMEGVPHGGWVSSPTKIELHLR